MTYHVDATWDDTGWWVVTVPGVPGAISQCRRLDQVRNEAAEVIEIQVGRQVGHDEVQVEPHLPGEAGVLASQARDVRRRAKTATEQADHLTRTAITALRREGFSLRDIGQLVGITFQRVQQLTIDEKVNSK